MNSRIKDAVRDEILFLCPKKLAHSYIYFRTHKKRMDFSSPKTYDEKIHWLMVNRYDKSYGVFADKIAVREYVREKGLEKLLIPLAGRGIYSTAEEIDFQELPDRYILKANHGSGDKYYYLCNGTKPVDQEAVVRKLNKALHTRFAKHYCQYHYDGIKPALICEQYLHVDGHDWLTDYKVVCSYGKTIAILVCRDRNQGRDYYSPDWEYLEYTKPEFRSGEKEERPKVLQEMLEAAAVLSEPFPLARVDFYAVGNQLYFGEITLTPSEGVHFNLNDLGQKELGEKIDLS